MQVWGQSEQGYYDGIADARVVFFQNGSILQADPRSKTCTTRHFSGLALPEPDWTKHLQCTNQTTSHGILCDVCTKSLDGFGSLEYFATKIGGHPIKFKVPWGTLEFLDVALPVQEPMVTCNGPIQPSSETSGLLPFAVQTIEFMQLISSISAA